MGTYTVKQGDSLSQIARLHGIPDWRQLYNDPQNAAFRAKRPNPNSIQPGDTINVPGSGSQASASSSAPTGASPIAGPTDDWIVVSTDGTCSEEAYNTTYRRDGDDVPHVSTSKEYAALRGEPTYSNSSFCKRFYEDAGVVRGAKQFITGGDTAGFWVKAKVDEGTSFLTEVMRKYPLARIALVGHSRGGMVAVLICKWLEANGAEVDFLGLYDAVDRAPNTSTAVRNAVVGSTGGPLLAAVGAAFGIASSSGMDASIIPSNVRHVRHALRCPVIGSRWWFGNTATEWAGATSSEWKQEFKASHGAIGGSVPHALAGKSFFQGNIADDSGWNAQDLTESQNTQGGAQADTWVRQGARASGVPI